MLKLYLFCKVWNISHVKIFGSHLIEYDCKSLSIISDVTLPRRSLKNEKNVPKNKLLKILDMLNRKQQGNILNSSFNHESSWIGMESFWTHQNYRLKHAQGVEKLRAEGGVSFIYDEPHKFERYHDQRERVMLK